MKFEIKDNIRRILTLSALALFMLYMAWTAVFGKNGLMSLRELRKKKEALAIERQALEENKTKLEKKVNRIRSKSLDLDALDEQARRTLGYVAEGEKVYIE